MASLIASFKVRDPDSTPRTSAPSNRMRNTFNSCRRISSVPMYTTHSNPSSAHTVAVATPCCPAPVSAITRRLRLKKDLPPAKFRGDPWRKKQRRRTPRISPQQLLQPPLKFPVPLRLLIRGFQFLQGRHQSLRHIPSAINPKPAELVP